MCRRFSDCQSFQPHASFAPAYCETESPQFLFRLRTIYPVACSDLIGIRAIMSLTKGGGARKRRKAEEAPSRRIAESLSRQDSTMTKVECLIEVAKKLREARTLGERSSDRALLYFVDMTIAHVCASLDARSQTEGAEDKHASRIRAAA
jgi:hypothetical protein